MNPLFTVSIAVHDRADLTRQCIESVLACSPRMDFEIIVFDNASGAETWNLLKRFGVGVIRSERNVGFGAAHNQTLAYARGTYFVVLNNDVVVQPGWLEAMRSVLLSRSRVGIAGPRSSACKLDRNGVGSSNLDADYVEGSCLMIPTWLARKEGLFDPYYEFAYCEDADLSLRLRKKGWDIGFTDHVLTHHRASTSQLVKSRGSVNLDEYHRLNHERLRARWGRYLQTRRFEEDVFIRRGAARGDVLMLTPVIRAMKERNAHATVHVETIVPEVLVDNPNVAISRSRNQRTQNLHNLDLCYERSPKVHIVEAYALACGLPADIDKSTEIFYPESERVAARDVVGFRKVVAIHPGVTRWNGRNWSLSKFDDLAGRLIRCGYDVAVVGDAHTDMLPVARDDWRGVPVRTTAARMARCKLFVGIDSFPMHIAMALRIPTVATFGAISPKLRLIDLPFIRGAQVPGLDCLGCHHEIQRPVNESQCRRERVYCMEDLTVDMVFAEVEKALEAHAMQLETSKIRDRVIQHCEGRGIDIGCSNDKIRFEAVGFDRRPGPDVDVVGDASVRMPFSDGEFDYVFSSHALEDIADTRATLAEWTRILRQGGKIIIQVPHPEHYKGFNADHVHPGWSAQGLSRIIENAGCKVVESFEDVGQNRYSSVVVAVKGGS